MEFESILSEKAYNEIRWEEATVPESFYDLNLDVVLSDIKTLMKEYKIEKYYYRLPGKADIVYRQGVLKDLENENLYQGILSFSNDMGMARKYRKNQDKSLHQLQRACWCMDGAYFYSQALIRLSACIHDAKPEGIGFQSFGEYLKKVISSNEFQAMATEANSLREEISSITYRCHFYHNRIVIQTEEKAQAVDEKTNIAEASEKMLFWDEKVDALLHNQSLKLPKYVENPFDGMLQLSDLEYNILEVIERTDKEHFIKFHEFYKKHQNYMNEILLTFEEEVQFYMSFIYFQEYLKKSGFSFSYPIILEGDEETFRIEGCYDMALASKNSKEGLPVILNDLEYLDHEKFFVITGPNQGGKTTFARSVGHVAYFSMLGLKAPCKCTHIPFFNNILTHFATEESIETSSGKLKEELDRLAPMMKGMYIKNLVLINELFTTATTYDAHIMGSRVMKHFMKNQCIGIYVTHIRELAKEGDGIVSLVAHTEVEKSTFVEVKKSTSVEVKKSTSVEVEKPISEDGNGHHIRTYKMLRQPAKGLGYAGDIVEKYHLSYEELKGRLV